MKITSIFTDEELALIDSGKYTPGRAALDAKLDLAMALEREACARVAADYGPSRPIVSKNPAPQIVGRWEGEQAASAGIEAAIRARGQA